MNCYFCKNEIKGGHIFLLGEPVHVTHSLRSKQP